MEKTEKTLEQLEAEYKKAAENLEALAQKRNDAEKELESNPDDEKLKKKLEGIKKAVQTAQDKLFATAKAVEDAKKTAQEKTLAEILLLNLQEKKRRKIKATAILRTTQGLKIPAAIAAIPARKKSAFGAGVKPASLHTFVQAYASHRLTLNTKLRKRLRRF